MVDLEAFNKMKIKNIIPVLALLLVSSMTSAYEVRSTMPALNLWDLFIEYTFGNFFMAVIVLAILFMIILAMGTLSWVTSIIFIMSFLLSMMIGYGYPIFSVSIATFGVVFLLYEIWKWAGGGT